MKIDHIAMYVYDLENMKQFFIDYFDAKPNDLYHNSKTGLQTYILSFSNGAKLELMNHPDMVNISQSIYKNGYIHISFSLGSKNAVDELTDRLRKQGYEVLSGPRITGDGYYESGIVGPEGNLLELTV